MAATRRHWTLSIYPLCRCTKKNLKSPGPFAWYCSVEKAIKSLIYCLIDLHGSPLLTTLVTHHWSRLYYSVQCSGHNELETKIFPRFASEIGNGDVLKACMPSCQVALLGKQLAAWSAVVNRLHKGSAVED